MITFPQQKQSCMTAADNRWSWVLSSKGFIGNLLCRKLLSILTACQPKSGFSLQSKGIIQAVVVKDIPRISVHASQACPGEWMPCKFMLILNCCNCHFCWDYFCIMLFLPLSPSAAVTKEAEQVRLKVYWYTAIKRNYFWSWLIRTELM